MAELQRFLALLDGEVGLLARLLYGSGLQLVECLRLLVEHFDFARHFIVMREGKGSKGRVVLPLGALAEPR